MELVKTGFGKWGGCSYNRKQDVTVASLCLTFPSCIRGGYPFFAPLRKTAF